MKIVAPAQTHTHTYIRKGQLNDFSGNVKKKIENCVIENLNFH